MNCMIFSRGEGSWDFILVHGPQFRLLCEAYIYIYLSILQGRSCIELPADDIRDQRRDEKSGIVARDKQAFIKLGHRARSDVSRARPSQPSRFLERARSAFDNAAC